ncbi:VWA domain-containing protein [Chloracidobacterium sp. MS 40/45]|jgi:Ca-activated chloride channel family protein|uniref:VWA domain-containing protein n=1 Tax=Chloracidobacterium aggregatum TaxID=2851959 RepID=UPI001B8D91A3|nr:VWA domain-containing protein [Chloracidobacterium aggregatum]QUV98966.1 VWA domain-containing protein [Chloracidobacterium sp. MS 40/45]
MKRTWQAWWWSAVWLLVGGSLSVVAQVVPVPANTLPGGNRETAADVVVRADYVTVLTSVNSTTGLPVQNLSDTDFEIYEDGQLQVISRVGRQADQPLRLTLLLDISASVRNRLKFEQEAALDFFRRVLRPQDRAAFYAFNHDVYLRQDLTSSLSALETAVRGLEARGATALYDAIFIAARRLEREPGRRVIIVVSDGQNTVSRVTRERALEEVNRTDAIIFGICPIIRTEYDDFLPPPDNDFDLLCRQTGGRVFMVTSLSELTTGFAQLEAELRAQYVLSYYSSNDARDGRFRRIEVRVKRPGVTVRARSGYYAPTQ